MAQLKVGEKEGGDSISEKLAKRLAEFGPADTQRKVEDMRYSKTTDQRAEMLSKAVDIIDKMEFDLRKLERTPDHITRDISGKVLSEGFTDKKFEEIKRLREKVEKAHKAFEKGWTGKEQKDFDDVKQLVSNQPQDKSGKSEGESGEKSS